MADRVKEIQKDSKKNILICWEHKKLTDLVEALGEKDAPKYPGESFVPFSLLTILKLIHHIQFQFYLDYGKGETDQ